MQKQLIKFVLVCAIPGDLSDRGVEVNFKTMFATNQWQGEVKLGHWARIPKHIVAEDAANGWPEHRAKIMSELHRWSGSISGNDVWVESRCKKILGEMGEGKFKPYPALEAHKSRQQMVTQAKDGNEGEEPWTVMNLDGLECVSAGVHVVGIMVGYAGYSSNKMTPSREGSIVEAFDMKMLPASIRMRRTA
jgi:hypothetical protein